jgi:prepilin-type N-terminal cleavage/methylation domain-containing protein
VRAPRRRAGFTLIELMIALTISALLVGMILAIFTRMSTAYRSQQYVAELQRTLTAAHDVIGRDVRQAGFQLLDGVQVANGLGSITHPGLEIRDNASGFGPDELHMFYADPSAQARVTVMTPLLLTVDNRDRFEPGDVVVVTNYIVDGSFTPPRVRNRACVMQIALIVGNVFTMRQDGTWGSLLNAQCLGSISILSTTMVYKFVARGYRIDATRRSLGVLQQSATGGIVNDWQDLGLGFTDLQVASRWYEGEDNGGRQLVDTADVDTDPLRDWYSGADQNTLTATSTAYDDTRPLLTEVRLTLVVRTRQRLQAAGAPRTPTLTDAARVSNNDVGNRASVTLAGVADASRPEELRGDAIFRYATVGIDLRNLAVGR